MRNISLVSNYFSNKLLRQTEADETCCSRKKKSFVITARYEFKMWQYWKPQTSLWHSLRSKVKIQLFRQTNYLYKSKVYWLTITNDMNSTMINLQWFTKTTNFMGQSLQSTFLYVITCISDNCIENCSVFTG